MCLWARRVFQAVPMVFDLTTTIKFWAAPFTSIAWHPNARKSLQKTGVWPSNSKHVVCQLNQWMLAWHVDSHPVEANFICHTKISPNYVQRWPQNHVSAHVIAGSKLRAMIIKVGIIQELSWGSWVQNWTSLWQPTSRKLWGRKKTYALIRHWKSSKMVRSMYMFPLFPSNYWERNENKSIKVD